MDNSQNDVIRDVLGILDLESGGQGLFRAEGSPIIGVAGF